MRRRAARLRLSRILEFRGGFHTFQGKPLIRTLFSIFYRMRFETQFTKLLPRFIERNRVSERAYTYTVEDIRLIKTDLLDLALESQPQ